jgi:hypothetical protein
MFGHCLLDETENKFFKNESIPRAESDAQPNK